MTEHGDHSTQGPLSGIRILAVDQFGAGPFATLFLADLGAEVIKIEDPGTGGDVGRTIPPGVADGDSLYFQAFNRGKRSIALDLKAPAIERFSNRLCGTRMPFSTICVVICRTNWG